MKPRILCLTIAVSLLCVLLFAGAIARAQGPTPPPTPPSGGAMTITQTLSDEGQRNTIAFDGLAFLTGNLGADSFFPPGKVADFWGFQYLRDNDPSGMGHNTDFLTRASLNMLQVLTSSQRAELITLAQSQIAAINEYGQDRFVLMAAFRRLLAGDLPAGTTGLDQAAVKVYSANLYRLDTAPGRARVNTFANWTRLRPPSQARRGGRPSSCWRTIMASLSPRRSRIAPAIASPPTSWPAGRRSKWPAAGSAP